MAASRRDVERKVKDQDEAEVDSVAVVPSPAPSVAGVPGDNLCPGDRSPCIQGILISFQVAIELSTLNRISGIRSSRYC